MDEFVMGDHARLLASMRFAMELAASYVFFANLFDLFASNVAFGDALACARGSSTKWLRVKAYRLSGARYSWAPRFRLAILLLLHDTLSDMVDNIEVVCPTTSPVERHTMEELGCVVTALAQQRRLVHEPCHTQTVASSGTCSRVNWSVDQLDKVVLLRPIFSGTVKMLGCSMSNQEKFGVTRKNVRRV
jgi:hypothetical protein